MSNTARILLSGEICEESVTYFMTEIRELVALDMNANLFIHSNGGDFDAACAIIDEMEGFKKYIDINTIALGKAYSAGAMILSFGTKRYMTKNSAIMLHPSSYEVPHDYHAMQKSLMEFHEQQYTAIMKQIAKNSGYEYNNFISSIGHGLWLNSKQALKLGFKDGIWDYQKETL